MSFIDVLQIVLNIHSFNNNKCNAFTKQKEEKREKKRIHSATETKSTMKEEYRKKHAQPIAVLATAGKRASVFAARTAALPPTSLVAGLGRHHRDLEHLVRCEQVDLPGTAGAAARLPGAQ
jgi:hypothetical protein